MITLTSPTRRLAAADVRNDESGSRGPRPLGRRLRGPVLLGVVLIAVLFGGLGGWSAVAPLASAAVAPGVISPDGSRRTVQHLEGGIIRRFMVSDGSRVAAGDPLVVLEDIGVRANRDARMNRHRTLRAIEARLLAEMTGADAITFPPELAAVADPEVAAVMADQTARFDARRRTHDGRKAILRQRIAQLDEEIAGLEAQIDSQDRQFELIRQEIGNVEQLIAQGLERLPRLLALQRAEAEITGARAGNRAAIARARQAIGETELQILDLDAQREDEVTEQLADVRAELAEVAEELRASEDVLARTVIAAPVAGTVVALQFHTVGGVIGPGEPILDIVPFEEDLLIDARVAPTDIDSVTAGLAAQVHLSAYRQRNLPQIQGRVREVSADRLVDEATGEPYFLARVEVDRTHLGEIAPDIELMPGMPAEVLILTGERTTLAYFLDPFVDTLRRGLREE